MRGFARIAIGTPDVAVADPAANAKSIRGLVEQAESAGATVAVFPELCLTGYTVKDLFHDDTLLGSCEAALAELVQESHAWRAGIVVGLPFRVDGALYNCAAFLQQGKLLGLVPKSYLARDREFEEDRWFTAGFDAPAGGTASFLGADVPLGTDLLFRAAPLRDLVVGIEICEDLWVQDPPSVALASAGANVILNLSASPVTVGKAELRRLLGRSSSDRGKCAYVYAGAGPGESSTDLVFDGDAFICENGALIAEGVRFQRQPSLLVHDVDLWTLRHERQVTRSFGSCAARSRQQTRDIPWHAPSPHGLRRVIDPHPFVPKNDHERDRRCEEVLAIQSSALGTRLAALGDPPVVLGLSGGLDSTLAALVAIRALEQRGRPRLDLLCISMPGPGTSAHTQASAEALARALGATFSVIPIGHTTWSILDAVTHPIAAEAADGDALTEALRQHPDLGDVTVENVQARLRTLLLMTKANATGGIVLGTGDLSEKALGWSTYAGDHISMYDVNAGVPKTLVRSLVAYAARTVAPATADVLERILATPISPELLPPNSDGSIAQSTEETLGSFAVHDFFLFHMVRRGASPTRILDLASVAFAPHHQLEDLRRWLRIFLKRFFAMQFKRSCTADGPKVGSVALSPRGDWRMPSDAKPDRWLAELESYAPEEDEGSSGGCSTAASDIR